MAKAAKLTAGMKATKTSTNPVAGHGKAVAGEINRKGSQKEMHK